MLYFIHTHLLRLFIQYVDNKMGRLTGPFVVAVSFLCIVFWTLVSLEVQVFKWNTGSVFCPEINFCGSWRAAQPTVWECEWNKNLQTIPRRQRHTDEGLCGFLRRGSEGHVDLSTDVILQPAQASNYGWEISSSASCNTELTKKKRWLRRLKFQDRISVSFFFCFLRFHDKSV